MKLLPSRPRKVAILAWFLLLAGSHASADDYYQGKTIRFIVGFSAGGGYDAYTRTVARYIGRYIPGAPSTVVENMDGAGSVIAANHVYNKAEPDGLTVGVFDSHNVFNEMMGDRSIRIDGRKLKWIGTPSKDSVACAIMGFTGLKSWDDIRTTKKRVRMGATRGGNTVQLPEMLNRWGGAHLSIIPGYGGTSKIRLAMRSREVDGACWTWDSMRSTARSMLDANGDDQMIPFVISERWEDPEVRDATLFSDVFKSNHENLHAFNVWNTSNQFARPFSLPPDSPPETLEVLRKAFKATMDDKDYVADLKRSNLTRDYVSGEEVEDYVAKMYAIPPAVKARLEFTVKRRQTS